jgi:Mn2+/Fe2+ NRAMP family transporter
MDLKLFGAWPRIAHDALVCVLLPVAFCGFLIALITGPLLFLTRPTEYIELGVFQLKLVLIIIGALSAIIAHLVYGLWLEKADRPARLRTGVISLICWFGALVAGRMIAFAGS